VSSQRLEILIVTVYTYCWLHCRAEITCLTNHWCIQFYF